MKSTILFYATFILPSLIYGQKNRVSLGEYKFDGKGTEVTKVYHDTDKGYIFYKADFDLDLDGSPFAYHPANTGQLHNGNGKNEKGEMSPSVVVYDKSKPYIQTSKDPAPGYYLSKTSLELKNFAATDYRRYVDPYKVTYFVLPGGKFKKQGVKNGDLGLIYNTQNKKYAFAIFADAGPGKIVGEGSIMLANKLGIKNYLDKKGRIRGGIDKGDILYIVFPDSGKKNYTTLNDNDVQELGKKITEKYGASENIINDVLKNY